VYTPESSVAIAKTNDAVSILQGGVVAYNLATQKSSSATPGPLVSIETTSSHRFVTIVSVAQGSGTKNITTTAVVEFAEDTARTVTVDSWVTNQT